jgi:hypothetical protein
VSTWLGPVRTHWRAALPGTPSLPAGGPPPPIRRGPSGPQSSHVCAPRWRPFAARRGNDSFTGRWGPHCAGVPPHCGTGPTRTLHWEPAHQCAECRTVRPRIEPTYYVTGGPRSCGPYSAPRVHLHDENAAAFRLPSRETSRQAISGPAGCCSACAESWPWTRPSRTGYTSHAW